MEVKVCQLAEVENMLYKHEFPAGWSLLSIRDSDTVGMDYSEVDEHLDQVHETRVVVIDDVRKESDNYGDLKMPSLATIKETLAWAKGQEHIIVHCTAGTSRSPAVGYLIMCQAFGAAAAAKWLNARYHAPNPFIIKLGMVALADQAVWDEFQKWEAAWRAQADQGIF